MVNASFKKYENYDKFITDFLITVIKNDNAVIIINYQDYQGLIASLHEKVINGNSLTLDTESFDYFEDDIETAKKKDGNIMVTVFKDGLIIGEPVLYPDKAINFVDSTYFIENDAAQSAMDYTIISTCIPFQIEKKIRL